MPTASRAGSERPRARRVESHGPVPIPPGWLSALVVSAGLVAALAGGAAYAHLRKDIVITVAGRPVVLTTFKRTIGEALAQADITLAAGDEISSPLASALTSGQRLVVRRAVTVLISADGKTVQVRSAAATVGELLRRRAVVLRLSDKVLPALDTPLAPGLTIRVVRIQHRIAVEQIEMPYHVRTSTNPAIPRGFVVVSSPGRTGLTERTVKLTVVDGRVVGREVVQERIVRTPMARVIAVGTQVQIASRGEFVGREVMEMMATAYSPWCCPGVNNVTALGLKAGYGVVAVDPSVIPLGSRLYIEGYGYAVAGDTGGWIKGLRIDLGFETKGEAVRFGRRPVRVYVLHKYEAPQKDPARR